MALRRAAAPKTIAWPSGESDRNALESSFWAGPDLEPLSEPPPGWTWGDVEAAWHRLGDDFLANHEWGPGRVWALEEWGKPRGAPASR